MEPREYLRLFRRRWWMIAAFAMIGTTVAWITAPAQVAPRVQRFSATHTLIVEPESRQFTPENPSTIALLASTGEVPVRVAERLELTDVQAERLLRNVTITGEPSLAVVRFAAVATTSERAQLLADTFAQETVTFLDEQELGARSRLIESAKQQATDLELEIERVAGRLAAGDGDPDVLEQQRQVLVSQYGDAQTRYQSLLTQPPANSGLRTLGPSLATQIDAGIQAPRGRAERAAILGIFGILIGLAAAIVLERLDVRIKTKEEAEAAFRLPVIAEIPSLPMARRRQHEVMSHVEPTSAIAEAYRSLRTTLLILRPTAIVPAIPGRENARRRATDRIEDATVSVEAREPQVFLVTSTRPAEGKTTTVVNLAAAFAEAGRSVLVVGADIRRPEAHVYLQAPRAPGLSELLLGSHRELGEMVVPTAIPGVRMLPSGAHVANPGELLLQAADLIAEARRLADIVLVDTTPMLTVNDAIQLMPATDAVIITCRAGRGTTEAAKRAQEMLARLRVPVSGVVLVGARETPGVSSYYYGYQASSSTNALARLRGLARRVPGSSRAAPTEVAERPAPRPTVRTVPPARPAPEVPKRPEPEAATRPAAEVPKRPAPEAPTRTVPHAPLRDLRPRPDPVNGAANGHAPANPSPARAEEPDPWGWP